MVSLTDEQVDFIRKEIESHGISLPDLQANLIDHMCTIIENEMSDSDDFHSFFYSILPRFFHDNLHEIEMETIQLIHQQKFKHMKKALNYVLALSSILLVTGVIFKIFHLPGAAACFVAGTGISVLAVFPLLLILLYKQPISLIQKGVDFLGTLNVLLFSVGCLFKVMHWPMATILMLSGISLHCLVYVPLYFYQQRRTNDDKWRGTLNSFLFLLLGIMLFMLFNLKVQLGW
jgi:hypothetical protein